MTSKSACYRPIAIVCAGFAVVLLFGLSPGLSRQAARQGLSEEMIIGKTLRAERPSWTMRIIGVKRVEEELRPILDARPRPTWRTEIVEGITVSAIFFGLPPTIQREIQAHSDGSVLWAVSFEAVPSEKDYDRVGGCFRRHWLELHYTDRHGADPVSATSLGFWGGDLGPEFAYEFLRVQWPLQTNLILLAPKDLLERPRLDFTFLDYPTLVHEPK